MWTSEDIWNRTSPIPGYDATPFASPFGSNTWPAWMQNHLAGNKPIHDNPEYRDPLYSVPNYLYVLVSNRSSATMSAGTERLRVYWAKASTGLSWDTQWVDYVPGPNAGCAGNLLYGIEITKPRVNAATLTGPQQAKLAQDIVALDSITFPPDLVSHWDKQDQIHEATHVHCGSAFLPWHRELVNRFEVMLRKVDPTVTLPYWDWTTDPSGLFSTTFMGSASGRADVPFHTLDNNGVLAGSRDQTGLPQDPPQEITRAVQSGALWTAADDAMVLNMADYPLMRNDTNGLEYLHNDAHGHIGGTIDNPHTSFEDPFVYLLHSQVDRLFAKWQRNPAALYRLNADLVYGSESNAGHDANAFCQGNFGVDGITTTMKPWDGSVSFNSLIAPWTPSGGRIVVKDSRHPSVVSPPYYDDVPLTIPALQPGQSVILQVPWYPPNPADFAPCFPGDEGHVCLLARIETQAGYPFGMTSPETTDLNGNVANNNNVIWRNVTVVDQKTGAGKKESVIVRNTSGANEAMKLEVADNLPGLSYFNVGDVTLDLGPVLHGRWLAGGSLGGAVSPVSGSTRVRLLSSGAFVGNIQLSAGEAHSVSLEFDPEGCGAATARGATSLSVDPNVPGGCPTTTARLDIKQFRTVVGVDHLVGGVRYELEVGPATGIDPPAPQPIHQRMPSLDLLGLTVLGFLFWLGGVLVVRRRTTGQAG